MSSLLVRRATGFVAGGLFFLLAALLLLADRGASIVPDVYDVVVAAGRRVEGTYQLDIVDRSDIPGKTDQIGHAVLWGSGMFLLGWLLRHRVPVALTALFMAGVSLVFEVSQPVVSTTRAFEATDAAANMTGIFAAAVILAAALWAWRTAEHLCGAIAKSAGAQREREHSRRTG